MAKQINQNKKDVKSLVQALNSCSELNNPDLLSRLGSGKSINMKPSALSKVTTMTAAASDTENLVTSDHGGMISENDGDVSPLYLD